MRTLTTIVLCLMLFAAIVNAGESFPAEHDFRPDSDYLLYFDHKAQIWYVRLSDGLRHNLCAKKERYVPYDVLSFVEHLDDNGQKRPAFIAKCYQQGMEKLVKKNFRNEVIDGDMGEIEISRQKRIWNKNRDEVIIGQRDENHSILIKYIPSCLGKEWDDAVIYSVDPRGKRTKLTVVYKTSRQFTTFYLAPKEVVRQGP